MIPLLLIALAADLPRVELDHGVALEADYLVHSVPTQGGELVTNDYLVIEAALLGPKNLLNVSIAQFKIRINRKTMIDTENPGMVINSMLHPEYKSGPVLDAAAGPVVISSRQSTPRFPGAPGQRTESNSLPVDQRVQAASLPEGDLAPPIRGLLFFPFRGKTKTIKSLELLYEGPAGKAALKLF